MIILATRPESALIAAERIHPFSAFGSSNVDLYNAWQSGDLSCSTVVIDGKSTFVLYWSKTLDGGLYINGCACLLDGQDRWTELMEAVELLARGHKCGGVYFHSLRAGIMQKAIDSGFEALSVCYGKKLK